MCVSNHSTVCSQKHFSIIPDGGTCIYRCLNIFLKLEINYVSSTESLPIATQACIVLLGGSRQKGRPRRTQEGECIVGGGLPNPHRGERIPSGLFLPGFLLIVCI